MESMMDQGDDSSNARGAGGNQENMAAVNCPAGPDDVNRCCDMCHDQFEQFFNEETEEWNLRSALKVDNNFYHPICYEDYKVSNGEDVEGSNVNEIPSQASLTLDETGLGETTADESKGEDDEDADDVKVVIKEEKNELNEAEPTATAEDDDDCLMLPPEEPVVTEIMDESEVTDDKQVGSEASAADDDVMIDEPKIETQLVPDDDDDEGPSATDDTSQNFIVKIKEEPQDDGYEDLVNEEDAFVEVTAIANDDNGESFNAYTSDTCLETNRSLSNLSTPKNPPEEAYTTNSPKAPFQPAQDENAMFDETSQMMPSPTPIDEHSRDMDDENNSRPESSGAPALIGGNKKLKIVLSSLAQNSLSNKNLNSNNVNDQNENSNQDSVNKVDSNSVQCEVQKDQPKDANGGQEEPEIEFQVKSQLQGVKFERNFVPVKRGFENSGLCSIM